MTRLVTLFRLNRFLFTPSMFQESEVRVITEVSDEDASTEIVELSALLSLTGGGDSLLGLKYMRSSLYLLLCHYLPQTLLPLKLKRSH